MSTTPSGSTNMNGSIGSTNMNGSCRSIFGIPTRSLVMHIFFHKKMVRGHRFRSMKLEAPSCDDFHQQLHDAFSSTNRRHHALRLLKSHVQQPNESFAMFAEDMARFFRRADADMPEPKKLRYVTHGLKEQLFTGLIRYPLGTVQEFITESKAIARALGYRCRQYNRLEGTASTQAAVLSAANESSLRELVRSIVREELGKLSVSST